MIRLIPGIRSEDFSYMESCYERINHQGINDSSPQFVSRVYKGIRRVYLDHLFLYLTTGNNGVKISNFNQYVFDEVHGLGLRREIGLSDESKRQLWGSEGRIQMKKEVLELIIRHAIWLRQKELNGEVIEGNTVCDYRCDLQSWLESQGQKV